MSNSIKNISDKARANILARLQRSDENNSGPIPARSRSADVFQTPENLLATFIEEFEKVNGQVFGCASKQEVSDRLQLLQSERGWKHVQCRDEQLIEYLPSAMVLDDDSNFQLVDVGITRCEFLIARSGSIMVSSASKSGRLLNVFPPVHVVIATEAQLVPFLDDALGQLKERYGDDMPSQSTVITGPSRTADIEKTLVMGAHGPKELILLIHRQ